MLDLVRDRDRPDALAYADALLRTGLVELEDLQSGLARAAGHRWVEQAREMVELADPLAESPGESWMRLRYHDAGFPSARVQLWVCEGATRYRLDLAREDEKAGFEYDGEAYHQPERRAHEELRHAWFEARGWTVLNFGPAEVLGRGHAFETAVADVLGVEPRLLSPEARRRTWAGRRRPSGPTTTA
jgi:very-short-patch-repair endonuclease